MHTSSLVKLQQKQQKVRNWLLPLYTLGIQEICILHNTDLIMVTQCVTGGETDIGCHP